MSRAGDGGPEIVQSPPAGQHQSASRGLRALGQLSALGTRVRVPAVKRAAIGTAVGLASTAVLTLAMVPLRNHLSIATTALVLVVPVVVSVVVGGFWAGVVLVVVGFLVYDYFFIPPYETLLVGALENWAALGVYVLVMLPVAQVVARLDSARARARRQGREIRELFELSHMLVEDKPLDVLLSVIVSTLVDVFKPRQVAILLPQDGRLSIVAAAGDPLTEAQLEDVAPSSRSPATLVVRPLERDGLLVLALSAAGRPVGLLVLSAESAMHLDREPLLLFANHIALAVERAQLREEALEKRLAEEMGRHSRTLVAAVSHDLRAPLASIKASSSTLADAEFDLGWETTRKLARLIDTQADRLADLVKNLLDMSRIQAGVLEPRRTVAPLVDLVRTVVDDVAPAQRGHQTRIELAEDLPPVDVDLVLIARVLTNLLENAIRHSPKGAPITIRASLAAGDQIQVSVTDRGPGVSPDRRGEIFQLFARRRDDTGAGLGLAIAKTFVEAHGQRIWVDAPPEGGARFCFTLPVAASMSEELTRAADPHH